MFPPECAVHRALVLLCLSISSLALGKERLKFLKDINRVSVEASDAPTEMAVLGYKAYFSHYDPRFGHELWVSDGTAKGTRMAVDICRGQGSGTPTQLTVMGGNLYFSAWTPANDFELWRSDGTAKGTHLVKDMTNLPEGGLPQLLGASTSRLWFRGESGSVGSGYHSALWATDGTAAGTFELARIEEGEPDPGSGVIGEIWGFAVSGDFAYMVIDQTEIWRSNGLPGGTELVMKLPGDTDARLTAMIGTEDRWFALLHQGTGEFDLWSGGADGEAKRLLRTGGRNSQSYTGRMHRWGNKVVFAGFDAAGARSMWTSDGTMEGTAPIPGNHYFLPQMVALGAELFFAGGSRELWKTDGTGPGTVKVTDFSVEGLGALFQDPVATDKGIFYTTDDGVHGRELWLTDGTAAGTRMLRDQYPGPYSGNPQPLGYLNGRLFTSYDSGGRRELWTSDGTEEGTHPLLNLQTWNQGSTGDHPTDYATAGKFTVFAADDGVNGREPWISNGTARGTRLVQNLAEAAFDSDPAGFTSFREGVLFAAKTRWSNRDLWFVDTVSSLAIRLTSLEDEQFVRPVSMVEDGIAYFGVAARSQDCTLWQTDGTAAGTVGVAATADLKLPDYIDRPLMIGWDGGICFWGAEEGGPYKLWHLKDGQRSVIKETDPADYPGALTVVGDRLAFFVYRGWNVGYDLWTTDQAGEMARLAGGFPNIPFSAVAGGTHCFLSVADDGASQWWKSDGTVAGTSILKFMGEGERGFRWDYASGAAVVADSMIYFSGWDPLQGRELWKTDGTSEGTSVVRDIVPGSGGSNPGNLVVARGKVYFTASDAIHGRDLWCTDGTSRGTVRIPRAEIRGDSLPQNLMPGDSFMLLNAGVPRKGIELHVLPFKKSLLGQR